MALSKEKKNAIAPAISKEKSMIITERINGAIPFQVW